MSKPEQQVDFDDPLFRITPFQQMAASCTGALLTSLLVTPLDVVKIRLQTQQKALLSNKCFLYCNGLMDHLCPCIQTAEGTANWYQRNSRFDGTIDAILKISKNEGIFSLWSGLAPTLVLAIPATVVYFVTYEQLRVRIKDWHNSRTGLTSQPGWGPLLAGSTARVFSVTLVSPLELVRTKMQSQRLSYFEVGKALRSQIKTFGITGLWRGLSSTLLRDVPFSGIYWYNYEKIKTHFQQQKPTFMFSFLAGSTAGSVAAILTTPFDVVKTHQQIELGEKEIYTGREKTAYGKAREHLMQGQLGMKSGMLYTVLPFCGTMHAFSVFRSKGIQRVPSILISIKLISMREFESIPLIITFDIYANFPDVYQTRKNMGAGEKPGILSSW